MSEKNNFFTPEELRSYYLCFHFQLAVLYYDEITSVYHRDMIVRASMISAYEFLKNNNYWFTHRRIVYILIFRIFLNYVLDEGIFTNKDILSLINSNDTMVDKDNKSNVFETDQVVLWKNIDLHYTFWQFKNLSIITAFKIGPMIKTREKILQYFGIPVAFDQLNTFISYKTLQLSRDLIR